MPSRPDSFRQLLTDAVADFTAHGYDSEIRLLLDEENLAQLLNWSADQLNQMENLFQGESFKFDPEALLKHLADQHDAQGADAENEQEQQMAQEEDSLRPPKPTIGVDSARVARLAGIMGQRPTRRQIGVR